MDFKELEKTLSDLSAYGIPSCAVSVWKDHRELFRLASGSELPPRDDTLFFMYSLSKPVTVCAAMSLWERGLLDLDRPVGDLLPEFSHLCVKQPDGSTAPAKETLTVRHLFTMTSGFSYGMTADCLRAMRADTGGRCGTREAMKAVATLPLLFEPGARYMYGLSHDILAACVEKAADMRFSDFVKKTVFEPLGMNDSFWHTGPGITERMAQEYAWDFGSGGPRKVSLHNSYVFGPDYESGGAGLISSLGDMQLFSDALACLGEGKSGARILKPGTVELIRTPALTPAQRRTFVSSYLKQCYSYGLGVRTCLSDDPDLLSPAGEFGWGGAAGALQLISPELGASAVYVQHVLGCDFSVLRPPLFRAVFGAFRAE